ncbi:cysteine-rich venom protein [Pogona vitticeps]|uniref:Cysteine-rich venom protein-like n=1 Tax=Pogona vitticeps TaxID=103695 RepID=A0A6J0TJ30_9SAUR
MPAKIQKDIIDKHNAIRRSVKPTASNMLKMTWDPKASETAKKWVSKCKEGISPAEERIVDGIYCGENVYQSTTPTSWENIIQYWGTKASNFRYRIGPVGDLNGSDIYTQLIWYNSHRVGCAAAVCKDQLTPFRYICHYCPAGNRKPLMRTPYKAGRPCEACPNSCENKLCTNSCKYADRITDCDVLLGMSSCSEELMKTNCKATCTCKTEIK